MKWDQLTLLTIAMSVAALAAPQAQQLPATQQTSGTSQVAQSRDAPVYQDSGYASGGAGGYASGGGGGGGGGGHSGSYGAPAVNTAYGAPAGGYSGGAAGASSGQAAGGYGQPGGNTGYYYYYYPVQEQKEAASSYGPPPKETYTATDSYGIDPLGIIAVLAVAGLVIAGLALLFPGWAYVRSDENVFFRALSGDPSFLGLNKDDYHTLLKLVMKAIEGEDCIEKMLCDASKLVKRVKKADSFLRIMEDLAPSSVSTNVRKLRIAMKKGDECSKSVTCSNKKKVL